MYESQLIIDADMTDSGWEIVLRFDAESMEAAWSDLSDTQLPEVIGATAAAALIYDRDRKD